jgi:hypothetical protein
LVNHVFTSAGYSQRTRFFVAERRSSLLGRGALVLLTRRRIFLARGCGAALGVGAGVVMILSAVCLLLNLLG